MEKFYIVSNEQFLKEISDYRMHMKERRKLINTFFKDKGIVGEEYHISGTGQINVPFTDTNKSHIRLYVEDCNSNNEKFGKELLKPVKLFCDSDVKMRKFRANSKTLKEFQSLCVEAKIVINNHPIREGEYFKELYLGGYSVSRFEDAGKTYLRIYSSRWDSITPKYDGFNEIKGSEFFEAFEDVKERNRTHE